MAAITLLITTTSLALLFHSRPFADIYKGPEFALRMPDLAELATLSREGLDGDCKSAYKVARHHLYYTLDNVQAIAFLRIAIRCPNSNAYARLAELLTDDPASDGEVDGILASLQKLDSKTAAEASLHIALRRQARKYR